MFVRELANLVCERESMLTDDVMMPQRIHLQYEACLFNSTSLIGCQVRRDPEGSTERYTRWINNISQDQL
uniref:Uncharacterized protein n=1 Tax=Oncorhynchus tshawytscha TaxID=74940 RepID=A0AAZ3QZX4_ONCTS